MASDYLQVYYTFISEQANARARAHALTFRCAVEAVYLGYIVGNLFTSIFGSRISHFRGPTARVLSWLPVKLFLILQSRRPITNQFQTTESGKHAAGVVLPKVTVRFAPTAALT